MARWYRWHWCLYGFIELPCRVSDLCCPRGDSQVILSDWKRMEERRRMEARGIELQRRRVGPVDLISALVVCADICRNDNFLDDSWILYSSSFRPFFFTIRMNIFKIGGISNGLTSLRNFKEQVKVGVISWKRYWITFE